MQRSPNCCYRQHRWFVSPRRRDRSVKNAAKLAVGATLVALLAAGCSSNQAGPKASATSSDVSACHKFGNEVIMHGPTTTPQERIQLLDQMELAHNANLRNEARAMKAAIEAQKGGAQLSAAQNIARICYDLGLVSRTGQPT